MLRGATELNFIVDISVEFVGMPSGVHKLNESLLHYHRTSRLKEKVHSRVRTTAR